MASNLSASLQKSWRQILWIVLAISIALPLFYPLGLPIKYGTETTQAYNILEKVPEGSIVLFMLDISAQLWPEDGPIMTSYWAHLVRRPLRVVVVSPNVEAAELFRTRVEPVIDLTGKTYGVDWVNLGYLPGMETGMKSLADDVWKTFQTDAFGTSFDKLSIMADLKNAADIKLIVYMSYSHPESVIRQFNTPYNIPVIVGTGLGNVVMIKPYLASGQIIGAVFGLRGAVEYDILLSRKSQAVIAMDSLTLSHIVAIMAMAIGNISYYYENKRVKEGKKIG